MEVEVELPDDSFSLEEELEGTSSPCCLAASQASRLAFSFFFRAHTTSSCARFISRCFASLGREEPRGTLSRLPSP